MIFLTTETYQGYVDALFRLAPRVSISRATRYIAPHEKRLFLRNTNDENRTDVNP